MIQNESLKVRVRDPQYDTNPGFVVTIRYKSMDSQNKSMFLQISYTIPASLKNILAFLQMTHYIFFGEKIKDL
jgi:hypothetical protein